MKGFNRFLHQCQKDLLLWSFFMLYLSFFRIAFILYFRHKIDGNSSTDILYTVLNGLRFDSMVATYTVAVPFFFATLIAGFFVVDRYADRLRAGIGALFIVLTSISWVIDFGYFREYDEQFNYLLFNLYYDDTRAIIRTIWADYHPLAYFCIMGLFIAVALMVQKRVLRARIVPRHDLEERNFSPLAKTVIVLVILSLLVAGSRGSIGRRPAQRKDVAIARDVFLNKAVVNPYFSLLYAVQDHHQQQGLAGLEEFLPDRNVRKAAQDLFGTTKSYANLDDYLMKHAQGPKTVPPRHIFLFVMESYDGWPFLPKYAPLGLTHELSRLGQEGLHFENFLPAGDGTMQSLSAIITSLPFTHLAINYQVTALKPYPSSIFETFKRLGYRTRLFYGGYLSWERFGAFAHDQGAEEIYGAPHMDQGVATHEWGVDDEYLMSFIEKTVRDDRPSFNLIMTTSYHPPYNVDVYGKGFPLKTVPPDVAPYFDNSVDLRTLGHLWYADRCLGDFVKTMEPRLTRPLFAFTGDHFGRKFINARPDFYEHSAVPLILYGKEVLRGLKIPRDAVGSHIDIGPTLIELTAPRGFTYYSVGRDLLVPRKDALGIGFFRVIGKDFLVDFSVSPPQFHPLPGKTLPKDLPAMGAVTSTFDDAYGIGWWRARQGPNLP